MLVLFFFLTFLKTGKVWANEVEIGSGIVCDEPQQVRRFVQVYTDDAQKAAETVNTEFNSPTACVLATVAFIRGDPSGREGQWTVTAILVVAIQLPHGWQPVAPSKFFSALKAEGERGA